MRRIRFDRHAFSYSLSESAQSWKKAWSLYMGARLPATLWVFVPLVLPYLLYLLLTLRAAEFDLGRLTELMYGTAYYSQWAYTVPGRLQALSSFGTLLSWAVSLLLLPGACCALSVIFTDRLHGLTGTVRDTWAAIKPRLKSIVLTGVAVMFASNLLSILVNLLGRLLEMLFSMLAFLPVLGTVFMYLGAAVIACLQIAEKACTIGILMYALSAVNDGILMPARVVIGRLSLDWRTLLPRVLWGCAGLVAGLLVLAALGFAASVALGMRAALLLIAILATLLITAAIAALCALFTASWVGETDRIYVRSERVL